MWNSSCEEWRVYSAGHLADAQLMILVLVLASKKTDAIKLERTRLRPTSLQSCFFSC